MMDNLKSAFRSYTEAVQSRLQSASSEAKAKGTLRLVPNPAQELRDLVDELEKEAEFQQLVVETYSRYSESSGTEAEFQQWVVETYSKDSESSRDIRFPRPPFRQFWLRYVQTFFRRSGYSIKAFDGEAINLDDAFQRYEEAFQKREMQITYLAPMADVWFANQDMDFVTFRIRRFKAAELEAVLGNRINQVFYHWVAMTTSDLERLQSCGFICVNEPAPVPSLGCLTLSSDSFDSRVKIGWSHFPKALESALQPLVLYNWQVDGYRPSEVKAEKEGSGEKRQDAIELGVPWVRFGLPFWLKVNDYLLSAPGYAPDTSGLEIYKPEGRPPPIWLNEKETEEFRDFTQRMGSLLTDLNPIPKEWQFLEIALGYLTKAFLTESIEQLLWHMTVLEALLGEKEKVTDSVARRLASIFGRTENERKAIKKQFKELYGYRCDLVHGNASQDTPHFGHLRIARNLARQPLLWFLEYLAHIQAGLQQDQDRNSIPQRDDILTLIDLDQQSRFRLRHLMENLPEGFPYVREWME
jgi:hypothetical protein